MWMFYTFFLTSVIIFDSIESASRNLNNWSPPSLNSNDLLAADEVVDLINDLGAAASSHSSDSRERTSSLRTAVEHSKRDHRLVPNPHRYCSRADRNLHGERDFRSPSSSAANKPQTQDQDSTDEPPLRARSRSPTGSFPSIRVLGYPLSELGYTRLTSRANKNLRFQFLIHIFAAGTPICWKNERRRFIPLPVHEHIVLSTSNGDIFAILDMSGVLLGIYRRQNHNPRAKINMMSGAIENLTPDEMKDCPVGKNHPIFPRNFIRTFSNYDSLQISSHHLGKRNPGSSSLVGQQSQVPSSTPEQSIVLARSYPPFGRPPSDNVIGYTIEQLGYVRLIPRKNQKKRFEFRRYVFPANRRILMRIEYRSYLFELSREYIVVSASNGDVFAILDDGETLRGIYRTDMNKSRTKINMKSGAVDIMTPDEIRDCPVGKNHPIFPGSFDKIASNEDSLKHVYH